jgi:integrase
MEFFADRAAPLGKNIAWEFSQSQEGRAMAVAKITKTLVDGLAPGALVWDTEIVGLGVRRQTTERKHYVLRYPIPQRGTTKQRIMSIGRHGNLTVDEARINAKKLLGLVASDRDPLIERRLAKKPKPAETSFAKAVEDYIAAKLDEWKPGTAVQVTHHLRALAKPLHPLAIGAITRTEVAEALKKIQRDSGPVARNRTRTSLSALFKWLDQMGRVPDGTNPAAGTAIVDEGHSRDRVLSHAELAEVWAALGDDHVSDIVRLLILTGQRRDEITKLRWSEIDFDKALLTLPPARTKNKRTHELPLAPQALAILRRWANREGEERSGANDARVFDPVGWDPRKKKIEAAILAKSRAVDPKAKPMPHWTLHDLRRTAATGMAQLGVLPHVVEAVLNHLSGFRSGVARIYNRNSYLPEMRAALELWAAHVRKMTSDAVRAA